MGVQSADSKLNARELKPLNCQIKTDYVCSGLDYPIIFIMPPTCVAAHLGHYRDCYVWCFSFICTWPIKVKLKVSACVQCGI